MSIALNVKAAADNGAASNTTVSVTLTPSVGDLIVVGYSASTASGATFSVSDNVNGSYSIAVASHANNTLGQVTGVQYFANNSTGSGITITVTATTNTTFMAMSASSFTGANTNSSGVLGATNQADGTGTSPDSGAIIPSTNGALVYCCCSDGDSGTASAGSGYTLLAHDTGTSFQDEFQIQSSAASIHGLWTAATSPWTCQVVAFNPPIVFNPEDTPWSQPPPYPIDPIISVW